MPYNICKSEPVFTALKNAIVAFGSLHTRVHFEWIASSCGEERFNFVESFYKGLVESHNKLTMSREYETSRPILLGLYESIETIEESMEESMEDPWESAGEAIYALSDVLRGILFLGEESSDE